MKKIIYAVGGLFGLLIVVLVLALVFAGSFLTNEFLVKQIESSISVRANIDKVNINLFSALSSIEVEGIQLTYRDDVANKGTPLSERKPIRSSVISIKKADIKLSLLGILQKKFELKKLVINEPKVSLIMFENGSNNLQPLFKAPAVIDGAPNPSLTPEAIAEKKREEAEAKAEADKEPSKPFSAKDIPVAIQMGLVGVKNGDIQITMKKTAQVILLKSLDFELKNIDIDGSDLNEHNHIGVVFNTEAFIIGRSKKEAAKFILETEGDVAPFIVKTGLVNPLVNYGVTMESGSFISGFAAFDAISGNLPILSQAGLKLDKLTEKAELKKDVSFKVSYSNGKVTFLDEPTFPTKNYDLQINKGSYLVITNNTHEMKMGVLYDEEESKKSIAGVDEKIASATKGQGNPKELRNKLLGNLIKDDRINIPFKTYGDIRNPNVQLGVEVGSLASLLGGAVKDLIKGKAGDALKSVPGAGEALKKFGF
ncbi:AsmA domain protein [Leptospira sp. 'Mane']|uniref:AsmA domain protein n=1 Tax=Leptospira sp. 'Mane' TaxID=3387407 RepID=UPI00398A9224